MNPFTGRIAQVVASDPKEEVWRRLRMLRDNAATTAVLIQHHDIPREQHKNASKQASQIAVCVAQAEEYFRASRDVSLATRPTLLYYGAVALSRAIILARRGGEFSIDRLRKEDRHAHHGLEIDRGRLLKPLSSSPSELCKAVRVRLYRKPGNPPVPWGHFPVLYGSLIPEVFSFPLQIHRPGHLSTFTRREVMTSANPRPIDSLAEWFSLHDILSCMPDIFFTLHAVGLSPRICRGNCRVEQIVTDVDESRIHVHDEWDFIIDGLTEEQATHFRCLYTQRNPRISFLPCDKSAIHAQMAWTYDPTNQSPESPEYFPDIVETADGRHFYLTEPDNHIHEAANMLAGLFALSILARYYPDVWMSVVVPGGHAAELFSAFLDASELKFPIIALDQIHVRKHLFNRG